MDEHDPHRDEDFLAVPPAAQGPTPASPVANPRRTRWTSLLRRPAALVTAGVLAGGVVVGVAGHELSQPASATTVATGSTGALGGAAPGGGPGGRGGMDGEQHLSGTLSAVDGSDVTVTTASDEQTFTVDGSTQVVQDGQEVAVSALTTGEDVVLHVHPSGDGWAVERVLAGTAAQGGPGGFSTAPRGSSDDQGTADPSTSTTTT